MVAYKKISEAGFLEIESKDLPQFINQKLASTYFFPSDTLFTVLLTELCHFATITHFSTLFYLSIQRHPSVF